MHINKKIRPPLSDGERISRLEQKARFQSIVILLLETDTCFLMYKIYQLAKIAQLHSNILELVTDNIGFFNENVNNIIEILQKLVLFFGSH